MTLLSTEDHSSWPPRKNRGETLILLEASLTAVQKRPENIEAAETAETANCASGRLGKKGTKCVGDARSGGDSAGGDDRGRCQMNRVAKDGGASVHYQSGWPKSGGDLGRFCRDEESHEDTKARRIRCSFLFVFVPSWSVGFENQCCSLGLHALQEYLPGRATQGECTAHEKGRRDDAIRLGGRQ